MTLSGINRACVGILNMGYYGCPVRDPSNSLKYKVQILVLADRLFDSLEGLMIKENQHEAS